MMKLIGYAFLAVCLLSPLGMEQRADAQVIIFQPPKKVAKYKRSIEELEKKAKSVLSGKAFESVKYKEKKTGKLLKYSELTEFAQKVIQINAIEKLTKEMAGSYEEWKDDLGKLKKGDDEKQSEKDEDIANFTDVSSYSEKLFDLRKEVAGKYETIAVAFFTKFPEKFTKEESQGYVAQMKRYHDTQKLVERKK